MNRAYDILLDTLEKYGNNYRDVVKALRHKVTTKQISAKTYDTIMCNYEKWSSDYKRKEN